MFLKVTETTDCSVWFYTTITCCFDPIRTAVMRDTFLTDFCKTILTKFAVVWVKRRQSFLSPRSFKITVTKEKERRTRESEEKERGKREQSNGCTLSFYNSYFGDSFWHKKTVGRKGPSGDNVFKNPARFKLSLLYRKLPIIAPPPPNYKPPPPSFIGPSTCKQKMHPVIRPPLPSPPPRQ